MIVGGSKKAVIDHIATLAGRGELNTKAELTDPSLSEAEIKRLLQNFYNLRKNRLAHALRRRLAYQMAFKATREMRRCTTLLDLERLSTGQNLSSSGISGSSETPKSPSHAPIKQLLQGGAIVTSNHFNPIDAILPIQLAQKLGKRLYIVSQVSNLALPRPLNFLTNNMDLLPLTPSPNDTAKRFKPELQRILTAGQLVLIYPEEEMWFNYRKPRPCRRGAYQFAAEFGVPIISCFTEMQDLEEPDNDEFYKLEYRFHILGVLQPDRSKSPRENSLALAQQDYELKKRAYELAYGKTLDYNFTPWDIAGWRG